MVHPEWLDLVSAAADDQLDAFDRARLDAHLATCPACAELLAAFERQRRVARLQAPDAHPELVAAVAGARHADVARRRADRTLARRAGFVVAVVAAAIMGVMVVPGGSTRAPRQPAPDPARLAVQIDATSTAFDRPDVEVAAGTTVVWHNDGTTTHHLVRQVTGATVTEDLTPGESEQITFAEPGTYRYYCTIHEGMTGTVTVDA